MNIQLDFDGFLDLAHILLRKNAGSSKKPFLADCRQLICHGLAFFSFKDDCSFAGIEAIYVTGERDDLNSVKESIRRVITYNYGRPLLSDLTAD
jgi:hypothetical protein